MSNNIKNSSFSLTSNHDVESCLTNIIIETIYVQVENDVTVMNNLKDSEIPTYEHPCPDEIGQHECDRALGEIYGNGIYVGDSKLNNTNNCTCSDTTSNGTEIYTDYNNYFNNLSFFQWVNQNGGNGQSRYNQITIDATTAANIAATTTTNDVTFSLEYAIETYGTTCSSASNCDTPHENITWVRVNRQEDDGSITLLYNGCPENNIITIDVCQSTSQASCDENSSDFLSSWGWDDNTTNNGYFELILIPDIPSNWPVPNDEFAPENFSTAAINRLSQTGIDLDQQFTQLNGTSGGFLTLNYVNGDIIQYSISTITYDGDDLTVEMSGLVSSELQSYQLVGLGDTFGICISLDEPEPSVSVTPTNTVTPTVTPTPTITNTPPSSVPTTPPVSSTPPSSPPATPTVITGLTNDCGIITILPMEVICVSKNSSGPDIPDGSTQIIVTGGTPPYTILWENGETTAEITGLTPGSYTVTVNDYYSDFVITVTCIVGSDSFYIDKFTECPDCGNISCYFNILPSPTEKDYRNPQQTSQVNEIYISGLTNFDPNMVYNFIGLEGCYEYDSTILWSGETYSALTIENRYDTCADCTPVIPPVIPQPTLCLIGNGNYIEFTPDNVVDVNGNYTWTNNSDGLVLTYNMIDTRWEVTPWSNVGNGIMVQNSTLEIPTGTFINLGNTQSTIWNMSEGPCTSNELKLNVISTPETCRGFDDGAAILQGIGGTPPYQYRIQGVLPYPNYSNNGVFTNLLIGNYLAEVLDSNGDTYTIPFTIEQGEITLEFNLNVTSNIVIGNESTRTWTYGIQIQPSVTNLLPNEVITFDINLTHTRLKRDTGLAIFSSQHIITKNNNDNIPYNTSQINTYSNPTTCSVTTTNEVTEVFTETATNVIFGPNDTSINGEVTQTVIIDGQGLDCSYECRMEGMYRTELEITNLQISGGTNCHTVGNGGVKYVVQELNVNACDALP